MTKNIRQAIGNSWGQRFLILLIIFVLMAILQPKFFSGSNVTSILSAISLYGIMSCGMLFVVLSGGIDLCVGSTAALSACLFTIYSLNHNYTLVSIILGIFLALLACFAVGLFHGVLITSFRLPAFVLTLATKYIIFGVTHWITGQKWIYPLDDRYYYLIGNGKIFSITMPIWILILFSAICAVILSRTAFSRKVYAVGSNSKAAELVGIRSKTTTIKVYIFSSVSAGIAGIVLASMNMMVGSGTASGYEGMVLMAMVVGGINLAGGQGGIGGAIFGALFVGIINNIQILIGVPADYQQFIQGAVIIAAMALQMYAYRKSAGLTKRRHIHNFAGQV